MAFGDCCTVYFPFLRVCPTVPHVLPGTSFRYRSLLPVEPESTGDWICRHSEEARDHSGRGKIRAASRYGLLRRMVREITRFLADLNRELTVRFSASSAAGVPLQFIPLQPSVKVVPGTIRQRDRERQIDKQKVCVRACVVNAYCC